MAETIEVICDVKYTYSQLLAGQTAISVSANESVVLRDVTLVNPKRRGVGAKLNNASWLPLSDLSYSFRITGTEFIPANSNLTLQVNSYPLFAGLLFADSSNPPYLRQTTFPTVFSDELGSIGVKDLQFFTTATLANATATDLTGGNAGIKTMFFDNQGNFYWFYGDNLFRRAGGTSGAQSQVFPGGGLAWAAFDKETGIVYALAAPNIVKRYDPATSTVLANVSAPSAGWSATYVTFAVRGGLMLTLDSGGTAVQAWNATTGAYIGGLQYSQSASDGATANRANIVLTKTSDNNYRAVWFNLDGSNTGNTFVTVANLGAAPLSAWSPTLLRGIGGTVNGLANSNGRVLHEVPYPNALTQDCFMLVNPGSPMNIRLYSILDLSLKAALNGVYAISGSSPVVLPVTDPTRPVADFGTIQLRAVGVRIK